MFSLISIIKYCAYQLCLYISHKYTVFTLTVVEYEIRLIFLM